MDARSTIAAMMDAAVHGGALTGLTADRAAWDRIVTAHRAARKALDADTEELRWDELSADYSEATDAVISTPAPDGQALLYKLEYLYGTEARGSGGSGPSYCAEWMDAFMADAYRLLLNDGRR
jgi:hypothetical protein